MELSKQIAKNLREIHFGGNWTASNIKDTVSDLSWQQATTQVYSFNTIATLVFHINYYVSGVLKVFNGGTLNIKDKYSFNCPPIQSQKDWKDLLEKVWTDVEKFAKKIEQLPEKKILDIFVEEKHGSYHRNLHGIIEHAHYHLGQIALIKKIILTNNK